MTRLPDTENGWQVRRGERGTTAYFFKRLEVGGDGRGDGPGRDGSDEDGVRRIPLLRSFTLFNGSQIDGIAPYEPPSAMEAPWRAPDAAELLAANSGAVVSYGGARAFYLPATDHIQMPPRGTFRTAGGFAGTLLHEMAHWTGAPGRLDRDLTGPYGTEAYAREEARAEIAACATCAELGIEGIQFDNSAAYVADWLDVLRKDRKEVFRATADAQRIADYLLAFHPGWAEKHARNGSAGTAEESDAGSERRDDAEEGAPLRKAA